MGKCHQMSHAMWIVPKKYHVFFNDPLVNLRPDVLVWRMPDSWSKQCLHSFECAPGLSQILLKLFQKSKLVLKNTELFSSNRITQLLGTISITGLCEDLIWFSLFLTDKTDFQVKFVVWILPWNLRVTWKGRWVQDAIFWHFEMFLFWIYFSIHPGFWKKIFWYIFNCEFKT